MSGLKPHINKKRHSSFMSFYESHSNRRSRLSVSERTRPSNPHRTLTERLMSLSASAPKALKLSMGPRPNNSLRSYKLNKVWRLSSFSSGKFCELRDFAYGQNLCVLLQNFLLQKPKYSSWSMPRSPQGEHKGGFLTAFFIFNRPLKRFRGRFCFLCIYGNTENCA